MGLFISSIVNQVKYPVASGRLVEGDDVPPIRVLEMAGVLSGRRTTGTYVSASGSPPAWKWNRHR